jgi:oligoribonuclease NrnB/cAMP/cGMP phosphodiesterase (DHH superfamily)
LKCFYHSADLDGHCSGAIVKLVEPHIEMIGIDYGETYPIENIVDGEKIFIVDFSFPIDYMKKIYNKTIHLHWIDHHSKIIKQAEEENFNPLGLREIGKGACELTYDYFYNYNRINKFPIPRAIKLLSDFDVWKLNNEVLSFQYGMRTKNTDPNNPTWLEELIDDFTGGYYIKEIIKIGEPILKYQKDEAKSYCKNAFESELIFKNKTYSLICINRTHINSLFFNSIPNLENYDIMVAFARIKDCWKVSFYTEKDNIDCSVLVFNLKDKDKTGGGHEKAAGFYVSELPFKI